MKEIFSARSTNGRWGVAVVTAQDIAPRPGQPIPGRLVPLGQKSGMTVFMLEEAAAFEYVVIVDADASSRVGAATVYREDLQSNRYATLLHVREGGVWEVYGYKRRGSSLCAIVEGERVPLSPAVALALGLVPPDRPPAEPYVPHAPEVPSAFASALAAALEQ